MSDTENALAVPPRNELAIVAKQAGDKAERLQKADTGCLIGGLAGATMMYFGAMAAIGAAPVAPVLLGVGLVSLLGCMVASAVFIDSKLAKAKDQQIAAIWERTSRLKETARIALEGAIADGTIHGGQDLRIFAHDETPKKLHIKNVSATIMKGEKKLHLTARILEEDGTDIGWLKEIDRVSLEQSVAAFPTAVLESIRNEISLAGSASTIEPLLTVPKPEKSLRHGPITNYRGPA
jgi:hypothetical protein